MKKMLFAGAAALSLLVLAGCAAYDNCNTCGAPKPAKDVCKPCAAPVAKPVCEPCAKPAPAPKANCCPPRAPKCQKCVKPVKVKPVCEPCAKPAPAPKANCCPPRGPKCPQCAKPVKVQPVCDPCAVGGGIVIAPVVKDAAPAPAPEAAEEAPKAEG